MGTRPIQGTMLLCLILLATSLSLSCNREPAPKAIDISRPTLQEPPTELWRKQIATEPAASKKSTAGWSLSQRPIHLSGGDILCVTTNPSFDTDNPDSPKPAELGGRSNEYRLHRLLVISPEGEITVHQELYLDKSAKIIPDPAGEFVAFVAQSVRLVSSSNIKQKSKKNTISVLDRELKVVHEFEVRSLNIKTSSLAASETRIAWEGYGLLSKGKGTTYPRNASSKKRGGTMAWEQDLPDGDMLNMFGIDSPITIDKDATVYLCQTGSNVYAINAGGQIAWTKQLDYTFKTHPVLIPGGNLALAGDRSLNGLSPESKKPIPGVLFILSADGETIFEHKLPSFPLTGPVALGETSLLINTSGQAGSMPSPNPALLQDMPSRLICISVDGEIRWDRLFETHFAEGSIQVVDLPGDDGKCILAAGDDGNLYSLDESGELLWTLTRTNIEPQSLLAGATGRFYVVEAGELVCYQWEG